MPKPPFFVVTLTHATWGSALACARSLPSDALPELRLDLFPDRDPAALVRDLGGRCLVTCRRVSEGGHWPDAGETARLERLRAAVEFGAAWVDLEWGLQVPDWIQARRGGVGLLRSVHVAPGVFDFEARLAHLPEGDAFKWVGHADSLTDNARAKAFCALAVERGLTASCFLMGPKGIPSRCLQKKWGGAFTYAAPDDGPPAAPGARHRGGRRPSAPEAGSGGSVLRADAWLESSLQAAAFGTFRKRAPGRIFRLPGLRVIPSRRGPSRWSRGPWRSPEPGGWPAATAHRR